MNTALVVSMPNLSEGIRLAFQVDAVLAVCGLLVSILFVGGRLEQGRWRTLIHRHRAHG